MMKKELLTIVTILLAFNLQAQWDESQAPGKVTTSSRVGIGTVNPRSPLHIFQTGPSGLTFERSGHDQYELKVAGSKGLFITNLTDGRDEMVFGGDGNIGIGTVNPLSPLHIFQTGPSALTFERSGHDKYGLNVAGTQGLYINNLTDGRTEMVFDGNGNIGIGTSNPGSSKLAVNGKIRAKEIKVESSGWSDFVFYDNYKLKTLEKVEQHINEKGHLPEIPSEAEVIENGINLGEMNAKLLQKIEELTLYLIQQNKEIKELKEKIAVLEN